MPTGITADWIPMTEGTHPSGHVTWPDLTEAERRIHTDVDRKLAKHEDSVKERFDRAHNFYTAARDVESKRVQQVERRVDEIEAVLDQLRGAKALIFFLIGSNLALVMAAFLALVVQPNS